MEVINLPNQKFNISKMQELEVNGLLKDNFDVVNYVLIIILKSKVEMIIFMMQAQMHLN